MTLPTLAIDLTGNVPVSAGYGIANFVNSISGP